MLRTECSRAARRCKFVRTCSVTASCSIDRRYYAVPCNTRINIMYNLDDTCARVCYIYSDRDVHAGSAARIPACRCSQSWKEARKSAARTWPPGPGRDHRMRICCHVLPRTCACPACRPSERMVVQEYLPVAEPDMHSRLLHWRSYLIPHTSFMKTPLHTLNLHSYNHMDTC
jgi:hypothetical protein